MKKIIKKCACGIEYDFEKWDELEFVGIQECDISSDLEMRNCSCGSTLAIEIDADQLYCDFCGKKVDGDEYDAPFCSEDCAEKSTIESRQERRDAMRDVLCL